MDLSKALRKLNFILDKTQESAAMHSGSNPVCIGNLGYLPGLDLSETDRSLFELLNDDISADPASDCTEEESAPFQGGV